MGRRPPTEVGAPHVVTQRPECFGDRAEGGDDPTYVDDLAALLSTTRQALRAATALPWAAKAAGLL
eukprot:205428-Pyramimonas_sp.AAC.1